MTRVGPARLLLGVVGIVVGVAAVFALKEATLSTHHRVDPRSSAVVTLEAKTKGNERGQTAHEMVESLMLVCRLEVANEDLVGELQAIEEVEDRGSGIYAATLRPALDETNQRQLRGCLEDWSIDHIRIDVLDISHK